MGVAAFRAQQREKYRRADECHDGAHRQLPRTDDGARDEIRRREHRAAGERRGGRDQAMIAGLEGEPHRVRRDEADKAGWQSNTRKLESAGAMGVEYSLSCPQGGDGAEGDIVSQNAELAAKIIDWVMEASSEGNPKLFKLTAAVTSIQPIIKRIQQVFAKYPGKQGGVTLANSFPSLVLRKAENRRWEEGVVIGMSGEGVLPISYLTLAKVSGLGVAEPELKKPASRRLITSPSRPIWIETVC